YFFEIIDIKQNEGKIRVVAFGAFDLVDKHVVAAGAVGKPCEKVGLGIALLRERQRICQEQRECVRDPEDKDFVNCVYPGCANTEGVNEEKQIKEGTNEKCETQRSFGTERQKADHIQQNEPNEPRGNYLNQALRGVAERELTGVVVHQK